MTRLWLLLETISNLLCLQYKLINMKRIFVFAIALSLTGIFTACHSNPKNSFGGPSNTPKDTAAKKRDTSSSIH